MVSNRPKKDLLEELSSEGYALVNKAQENKAGADQTDGDAMDEGEDEANPTDAELSKGYDYLLGMKLWSLTMERVSDLRSQLEQKEQQLEELRATTPEDVSPLADFLLPLFRLLLLLLLLYEL